jgi:hypothetical protein
MMIPTISLNLTENILEVQRVTVNLVRIKGKQPHFTGILGQIIAML